MTSPDTNYVPVRSRLRRADLEHTGLNDFPTVLYLVWLHLGFSPPDDVQLDLARFLQYGPEGFDINDPKSMRQIIQAFRGVGKTWVTACFVCWCLLMDKDLRILICSKSGGYAEEIAKFIRQLINEVPIFQDLDPSQSARNTTLLFDVAGASPNVAPSVKAIGIDGALAGNRADIVIPDDVETLQNSMTQLQRDRLIRSCKEFDAIVKPGGLIIYLGTPQVEDSLYTDLETRGYTARIWPVRYPTLEQQKNYAYWNRLAPMVRDSWSIDKVWKPLMANSRFSEADLQARQDSYGLSDFMLQYMLDTSLSDRDKFPLKLRDIPVLSFSGKHVPVALSWTSDTSYAYTDSELPSVGMQGDRYHRPFFVSKDWEEVEETVLQIDPSGRGKDFTSYNVTGRHKGRVFGFEKGGVQSGYEEATLISLAQIAAKWKVNKVRLEDNFGDGMFTKLFEPVLQRHHACTVEEHKSSGVKEFRMLADLEPVIQGHRFVASEDFWRADAKVKAKEHQLAYQLTRLFKAPKCLKFDDDVDALSMALAYHKPFLGIDIAKNEEDHKASLKQKALDDFIAACERLQFGLDNESYYEPGSERLLS